MELRCWVEDPTIAEKADDLGALIRRVVVHFEDNGIGMGRRTIQEGLLRVGATAHTRQVTGRKQRLTECGGGFGMIEEAGA